MPWKTRPMKICEMWKEHASMTAANMKARPEYIITRLRPWYLHQAVSAALSPDSACKSGQKLACKA